MVKMTDFYLRYPSTTTYNISTSSNRVFTEVDNKDGFIDIVFKRLELKHYPKEHIRPFLEIENLSAEAAIELHAELGKAINKILLSKIKE